MIRRTTNANRPVILLAFAGEHGRRALPQLSAEREAIRDALKDYEHLFQIEEEEMATLEKLTRKIQRYADRLVLFHFAGHADPERLMVESADGEETSIYAHGFADLLSSGGNLQLVFLNGCSTAQQAKALLNNGVNCVIGTTHTVQDDVAIEIARTFYTGLATHSSVGESFEIAETYFKSKTGMERSAPKRDLNFAGAQDDPGEQWHWELMTLESRREQARRWSLHEIAPSMEEESEAEVLLGFMCDRTEQISHLFQATLPEHLAAQGTRPLGLIVHGPTCESLHQFLWRIEKWELPRELKKRTGASVSIEYKTVAWENNVELLQQNLLDVLGDGVASPAATIETIQEAIVKQRSTLLICTAIAPSQWQPGTLSVLEQWLALFANFSDLPDGQLVLPVLLVFDPPQTPPKWQFWRDTPSKNLKKLKMPEGMTTKALPRLTSVQRDDVVINWLHVNFEEQLREHLGAPHVAPRAVVTELTTCVDALYANQKTETLPMATLAPFLNNKIRQIMEAGHE